MVKHSECVWVCGWVGVCMRVCGGRVLRIRGVGGKWKSAQISAEEKTVQFIIIIIIISVRCSFVRSAGSYFSFIGRGWVSYALVQQFDWIKRITGNHRINCEPFDFVREFGDAFSLIVSLIIELVGASLSFHQTNNNEMSSKDIHEHYSLTPAHTQMSEGPQRKKSLDFLVCFVEWNWRCSETSEERLSTRWMSQRECQ